MLRETVRRVLLFLAGVVGGVLPLLAILAASGTVMAFLRASFVELPSEIVAVWGLPIRPAADVVWQSRTLSALMSVLSGDASPELFLILLAAIAAAVLMWQLHSGRVGAIDGAAIVWLGAAFLALRGVLGRADAGHLALYGLPFGALAAWLLRRAAQSRWAFAAMPGVALFLLARLHPLQTIDLELAAVSGSPRLRETLAAQGVLVNRSGRARLPADQAEEIALLKTFVDSRLAPGETFFDFSNEPALFFLLSRRMPVRFLATPFYETAEKQIEVIRELEKRKPPLAILAGGTWRDAFDGVPNRQRVPLVAAYLDSHYSVVGQVSRWTIGARRQGG